MTGRGPEIVDLPGGPSLRLRSGGPRAGGDTAVLLFGGSSRRDVAGAWSPTAEWLARRIARRRPELLVAETRYRHGSWRRSAEASRDGETACRALEGSGVERIALIGFSLGGAVAAVTGRRDAVAGVIGLAAWLPPSVDLGGLGSRPLRLIHGTADAGVPGLPGVSPEVSERAVARARSSGVDAQLTLIPGGVHGVALRAPWGGTLPLPRAGRWGRLVDRALDELLSGPGRTTAGSASRAA